MMGARQRSARRRLALLAPLGALLAAGTPAYGGSVPSPVLGMPPEEETTATWLSWRPPPECPRADFVLERVRGWLGGTLPDPAGLRASGEVNWTGEQWEITVVLLMQGTRGERRVRVATCADAAEFLAVAIVLAVDPSRGAGLPALGETPVSTTEVPLDPALEETTSEEAALSSETPTSRPVSKPAAPRRGERTWFLGARAEGVLGALPSFQVGPVVEGGLQRGALTMGLGAHFLPPVSTLPAGAVAAISYALAAGRLGACYLPRLGPLALGPCANVDVGALWTNQDQDPDNIATLVPWVDVQLGGAARFFGPVASLVLGARLSIPLTQPRFVVSSDTLVHQPTVGVVFDAGLQFFFGRR
jgi:hypothetical protein